MPSAPTVYRKFRGLFDAHQYPEALPLAQQLVTLTEQQYSATDRALVNPLCNLATTAYRLKDYPTAELNYMRSVGILESAAASADRQILRPLQGLGTTYIALQQYEDAVVPLQQAVDLSRNLDGLFNIEQLAYLEPLIQSFVALDRRTDAEKEQQYALRVAESAYGNESAQMLGPLDRYARWLEDTGRYTTSRGVHARALTISEKSVGKLAPTSVNPLLGIARTYRLEFLNGSEVATEQPDTFGQRATDPSGNPRLNADGERALLQALYIIDKGQPVDHRQRGQTLMELGDWYLSGGAISKAMVAYREAWTEFEPLKATLPLETPMLIAYKGPSSSAKRSSLDPETASHHYVELSFTVLKDGHTSEITVAGSDAPEALQHSVESSLKKARYRPRFEKGVAVETKGVTLREQLLLRKAPQKAPEQT